MKNPIDSQLHSHLRDLEHSISQLNAQTNLDGLLAIHFDSSGRLGRIVPWQIYLDPKIWMQQNADTLHDSPSLAILGCLLAQQANMQQGNLAPETTETFREKLAGLQKRQNVFSLPNSWIWRLEVVLGITLGAKATHSTELADWLLGLFKDGFNHPNSSLLTKLIYGYTSSLLGDSNPIQHISSLIKDPNEPLLPEIAFIIWLVKKGILSMGQNSIQWLDEVQPVLVERLITNEPYKVGDYKTAIIWEVVTSYIEARSHYPTQDKVVSLLSNFLPGMERWLKKWPIENEADVQALLFLILRSAFTELRYEEYLPKLGRSGQRYDFGLPSLGLIIELKYIYPEEINKHAAPKKQFQAVIEDISKDIAQLQPQNKFTSIVVFVYDESRSAEHHEWTRQALESISHITKAIIVSAPALLK